MSVDELRDASLGSFSIEACGLMSTVVAMGVSLS